jgi:predicted acylesterase/phospholipase RssA
MDLLKITKIWEAARATSAATTFFEPITIGDETFCDGATGVNNPVWRMFDEAGDVFSDRQSLKDEDIRCIVSIGTGVRPFTSFGPAVDDVARGLKDIATESEETADSFQRNKSWLLDSKRAFRFNVSPGLENVSLEEHEKFGDIKTVTRHYVQTPLVHDQIKHCVKSLTQRVCKLSDLCDSPVRT